MDSRVPSWLRAVVRKLDFIGIPNLAPLLCGMAVLAFIGQHMGSQTLERFYFDPRLILMGEWWRLFTFPIAQQPTEPIWFIFSVLYIYFVVNALEHEWGAGPLTVFLAFSYLSILVGAFITMMPIDIWYLLMEIVGLTFGTLFPEFEMMLFMILPVKAKWLAMLTGVFILLKFVAGGIATKILIASTLFPYFLFFGPYLFKIIRDKRKVHANRKRFDKDMWR